MDRQVRDLPADDVEAIGAPTLLIIGDSDIVRPEHAVEMFRLLGGVMGDLTAYPIRSSPSFLAPLTRRWWNVAIGWLR